MRLFTGFDLPPGITSEIAAFMSGLHSDVPVKWSRPENLHITAKFIGEWPESSLAQVREALSSLPPCPAIPITVRGLGFHPNHRSPASFWAGIEASPTLWELVHETNRALAALGIEAEKRTYSPHLTLARIRKKVPLTPLKTEIARTPPHSFGSFTASSFYLYLSEPSGSRSVYTKLSEFPLRST